jgi:hypothetical protein
MVDDAHADVWAGVVRWDPKRCTLLAFVCMTIKGRTWRLCRDHKRRVERDEEAKEATPATAAIPPASSTESADLRGLMEAVCYELRGYFQGDDDATQLIDCWEESRVDKADVKRATGFSEPTYNRVRRRVLAACNHLSPALRARAATALRSAS